MSSLALDDPWFLLLLPLAALGFWRLWRRRPTLRFSAAARFVGDASSLSSVNSPWNTA